MTPATDLHPDYATGLMAALAGWSAKARDSAHEATLYRQHRDNAIRHAHAQGLGVREIARACNMDATQVSRTIRRETADVSTTA